MNFFRNHWNDFAAPPKGCKKPWKVLAQTFQGFAPFVRRIFQKLWEGMDGGSVATARHALHCRHFPPFTIASTK